MKVKVRKARHAHGYVIYRPGFFPQFVEGPQNVRVEGFPFAFMEATRLAHRSAW